MILPSTKVLVTATGVEFLSPTAHGAQIVRIDLRTKAPTVTSYCLDHNRHMEPFPLTLEDINEFIASAVVKWRTRFARARTPKAITPMTWDKAEVKSGGKVVGTVDCPVFEETNPGVGVAEIQDFDWKQYGYASWQDAVVKLVNTQHATNLKNKLRSEKAGAPTMEQITNMAVTELAEEIKRKRDAGEETFDLNTDPQGFLNALTAKKAEIKARYAKKAEQDEADDAAAPATA